MWGARWNDESPLAMRSHLAPAVLRRLVAGGAPNDGSQHPWQYNRSMTMHLLNTLRLAGHVTADAPPAHRRHRLTLSPKNA